MATKEKKATGRKQTSTPVPTTPPSKDTLTFVKTEVEAGAKAAQTRSPTRTSLAKKLMKQPKKFTRSNKIALQLKAKTKPALNKRGMKKGVINPAALESKGLINKNGVKARRGRAKKIKTEIDEGPPVLEPIFPVSDNPGKQQRKKGVKKANSLCDLKKVKQETEDISMNEDLILSKQTKKKPLKRIKVEGVANSYNETIEEVINDLTLLIKGDEIKKESDSMSESGQSDTSRSRKRVTKQKLALLQEMEVKKENIENTPNEIGPSDQKVIDMLDLNVGNVCKTSPVLKRRHSIEKFPLSEPIINSRSCSPRLGPKEITALSIHKNVDASSKKLPQSSSSEPSVRTLRNGKHRKLNELQMADGLANPRKRRRLCSELSGSEKSTSKLSGYDSDSSFSDMASLNGTEVSDVKANLKTADSQESFNATSTEILGSIKRSLSMDDKVDKPICDSLQTLTDTNSNLCGNLKLDSMSSRCYNDQFIETEKSICSSFTERPSAKVPDKCLILDIMKQTFNEGIDEIDRSVDSVQKPEISNKNKLEIVELSDDILLNDLENKERDEKKMSEIISKIVETMGNEEFTSSIVTSSEGILQPSATVVTRDCDNWISEFTDTKIADAPEIIENPGIVEAPEIIENLGIVEVPEIVENLGIVEVPEIVENLGIVENPGIVEVPEVVEVPEIVDSLLKVPETSLICEMPTISNLPEYTIIKMHEDAVIPEAPIETTEPEYIENAPKTDPTITDDKVDEPERKQEQEIVEARIESLEESPEQVAVKENILKALGLRSLKSTEEQKAKDQAKVKSSSSKPTTEGYTGTLKTVIKLNRDSKKKGRNSLKLTLQKSKPKGDSEGSGAIDDYKIMKEGSSSWKQSGQSSDTAEGSSEHTSDGEMGPQDGTTKALVIPEKASSFSIHPERLCKDECSYCCGKFGLFDTPCHIAQMKSVDRQDKILATETHLQRDSCLCDACYRHIDRKANTPSYNNRSLKRGALIAPVPRENHCHVLGCNNVSNNILKRKWIIKMRKSICQVINIDLDNPGLHSIPICEDHYLALEHLMVCAMCKRRLARNHVHYIGLELEDLNDALNREGVPLMLFDKPVVCKMCKCFASIVLQPEDERPNHSTDFFVEYKRRLLHFNNIVPMDEEAAEEPIIVPSKEKCEKEPGRKRRKLQKHHGDEEEKSESKRNEHSLRTRNSTNSNPESPAEYQVDCNALVPAISMDCSGSDNSMEKPKTAPITLRKLPRLESVNNEVEITHKNSDCENCNIAVQKLGSNPSISVRQLFPGEEELGLQGNVDFNNVKEKTPEGWEKCNMYLQYDRPTKQLWHELQKPYGNPSSFLRHLILLEKYFRNGDLELSSGASHHSANYSASVHNRLRAYDNIPSSAGPIQPLTMVPFNNSQISLTRMRKHSGGGETRKSRETETRKPREVEISKAETRTGEAVLTTSNLTKDVSIITSQSVPPPIIPIQSKLLPTSVTQLNAASLIPVQIKPKPTSTPPGLISLLPGTNRPAAPLVRVPHSQKIKFPITKNWRPNLIPIDPSKPQERKSGLVQVISGGKPFHITLEDYKKMCAIKRSFEMKQKRLQDATLNQKGTIDSAVLKNICSRKGLIISKSMSINAKGELVESETTLEKLDRQVENLETKFNEEGVRRVQSMPKIPKSLTVIPQTVPRKVPRSISPSLMIASKAKMNVNRS